MKSHFKSLLIGIVLSASMVGSSVAASGQAIMSPKLSENPSEPRTVPATAEESGRVNALCVFNGKLLAGGEFSGLGGTPANNIASWDGTTWSPLGSGISGAVYALSVYNNKLIAGGMFSSAGGVAVSNIAAWDGTSWAPLGPGVDCGPYMGDVCALTVYDNKLVVGGNFCHPTDNIAYWDGSSWSSLSYGTWNGVWALTIYNGQLIAGGVFSYAGGVAVNHIAAWNGTAWATVGSGTDGEIRALNGGYGLLVGGFFQSAGGVSSPCIAIWNGFNWGGMATGTTPLVLAVTTYNGQPVIGGTFDWAGGKWTNSVAIWRYSEWDSLGTGFRGSCFVGALTIYNGLLVAGGGLSLEFGDPEANVAYWNDGWPARKWLPLVNPKGQVAGHVYDNGQALEGVTVEAYKDGSLRGSGITNSNGRYGISNLVAGQNELRASKRGYQTSTENVQVVAEQETTQDFTLTPTYFRVVVLDASAAHNPIPDKEFKFIKVTSPQMSEQSMGNLTTDGVGSVQVPEKWYAIGDLMKVQSLGYPELARKHTTIMPTMYTIRVDNATFDASSGDILFTEVTSDPTQDVTLSHTTICYDLLVSVEWDADDAYLNSLVSGLRQMSNYLYDVTDGQLYINEVKVFDDKVNWDEADIQIEASNMRRPWGEFWLGNIRQGGGIFCADRFHVYFPRIFYFNDYDANRNLTYSLFPYDWTVAQTSYYAHTLDYPASRTLAHEFGHYGLGFLDEYIDTNGHEVLDDYDFGFMDNELTPGIAQNTEMSSALQYPDAAHRITAQWFERGNRSCWDYFEWQFQDTYDGIYANIKKPVSQMFAGPNDSLQNLNYDVGSLLKPDVLNPGSSAFTLTVISTDDQGIPLGNAKVTLFKNNPNRAIEQGNSTDNGHIYCLGTNCNDIVRTCALVGSTFYYKKFTVCGSDKSVFDNSFATSADGDSIIVTLRQVQGDFRMLNGGQFGGESSFSYEMKLNKQFSQVPALEFYSPDGQVINYAFVSGTSGYATLINDNLGEAGLFSVLALDDGANTFFVNNAYRISTRSDALPMPVVVGPEGRCELVLDTSNSLIEKILVLSSDFPPLLGSIDPGVAQAGGTHCFVSYPEMASLNGTGNHITIRYSEYGLPQGVESSLQVHRWDDPTQEWVLVGGAVDTSRNEVTSAVSDLGTYTLFAAGNESCCNGRVGDANGAGGDEPTISDISTMIDALFISGNPDVIACLAEADVNQSGESAPQAKDITIGDISMLIDYLFITGPSRGLPDCL